MQCGKYILIIALLCVCVVSLNAQIVSGSMVITDDLEDKVHIFYGATMSYFGGDAYWDYHRFDFFNIGGSYRWVSLLDGYVVEPGVRFISRGVGFENSMCDRNIDDEWKLLYMDIFTKIKFATPLTPFLGLSFSYLLEAESDWKVSHITDRASGTQNVSNALSKTDFALLAGVDYTFEDAFTLGVDYNFGLLNIYKGRGDYSITNRTLMLTLGVLF